LLLPLLLTLLTDILELKLILLPLFSLLQALLLSVSSALLLLDCLGLPLLLPLLSYLRSILPAFQSASVSRFEPYLTGLLTGQRRGCYSDRLSPSELQTAGPQAIMADYPFDRNPVSPVALYCPMIRPAIDYVSIYIAVGSDRLRVPEYLCVAIEG